ncbi:nuclear transport factor 2 family protein [Jiangella asiatica]|uniref:Nuclear transport factor 2 family protein n=1 Tax=Jiangella asiatica TaxID=2530372 RepID=A0A4R5CJU5_9ACTN|nr:nuclear transport factor 2 family protein [Jiangella asiatica]
MISTADLTDPTVRSLVTAINDGDRAAFLRLLTPDATLTDDGTQRNLEEWIDREIFTANGHMDVDTQSADGLALTARFRNDTWGEMRTTWAFTVADGKIGRLETGQA